MYKCIYLWKEYEIIISTIVCLLRIIILNTWIFLSFFREKKYHVPAEKDWTNKFGRYLVCQWYLFTVFFSPIVTNIHIFFRLIVPFLLNNFFNLVWLYEYILNASRLILNYFNAIFIYSELWQWKCKPYLISTAIKKETPNKKTRSHLWMFIIW